MLRHYDMDQAHLARDLTRALDRLKTGNARTPALSPRILRLISEAWTLASIDFNAAKIRSGHLLLALLRTMTWHGWHARVLLYLQQDLCRRAALSICLTWWLARERTSASPSAPWLRSDPASWSRASPRHRPWISTRST